MGKTMFKGKQKMGKRGKKIGKIACSLFKGSGWALDNTAACLLFSSEAVVKQFLEGLAKLEDQTPMLQVAEVS